MNEQPYIWQMIKEAIEYYSGRATNNEIKDYINERYEGMNQNSISNQIMVCTVNQPSRIHFPENKKPRIANSKYDLLYSPEKGVVEQYDPQKHGHWEIREKEDGGVETAKVALSHLKKELFQYIGPPESLHSYQKAYKLILFKSMIDLVDQQGQASMKGIIDYFREFYLARKKGGYIVEDQPDSVISNIETSSDKDIERLIRTNPLRVMAERNFLDQQEGQISFPPELWNQLSREDLYNIEGILNKKLHKYLNEKLGGDHMLIPDVSREKLLESLVKYDTELRAKEEWRNFTQRKNHRYAISHDNKLYPIKKIISMATGQEVANFYGGEESNQYLREKGFNIVELKERERTPLLKNLIEKVMGEYNGAKKEVFTGHELGNVVRHKIPSVLKSYIKDFEAIHGDDYYIRGSVGQSKWANVPWVALMDKKITTTTQEGVYIVYLFSQDMERLYLTFNQGVTNRSKEQILDTIRKVRETMDLSMLITDDRINIASSGLGKNYEASTIGYIEYRRGLIPREEVLVEDLEKLMGIYRDYKEKFVDPPKQVDPPREEPSTKDILRRINNYISSQGFTYPDGLIENFYLSLKTKPFVLLAGISGTGKTKLVKLFAEAIGCTEKNERFKIIPVRPDWNDSYDLLGYCDIKGVFKPGPIIDTIRRAMEDKEYPYIICLDEMNLARVEYYFSDFLSIMETRKKEGQNITTSHLVSEDYFGNDMGNRERYRNLSLPDNLYIVGTVNMDETTQPFSKKVLDRANTIEFSDIHLQPIIPSHDEPSPYEIKNDPLKSYYITLKDAFFKVDLINGFIDRLGRVNHILKQANLQVGYRVRDEICFYMLYNREIQLLQDDLAFDYQMMQKILPRIQGSSSSIRRILIELFELSSGKKLTSEGSMGDEAIQCIKDEGNLGLYPHSARKIAYMLKRFEEDGFTAFWL